MKCKGLYLIVMIIQEEMGVIRRMFLVVLLCGSLVVSSKYMRTREEELLCKVVDPVTGEVDDNLAAEGARIAEASRIIGVDLNSNRFEEAKKFGVTEFVNPKDYEKLVQEVIAEMTNGGADRSVECTGHIDAMISAFECIHDVLDNGLLVDPHDQQSIANALLKLVADKQLWASCRQNGLKNIHLFSWPEHCKTYLSHIASCKPRHLQWPINDDGGETSESDSPDDSLRDIQDIPFTSDLHLAMLLLFLLLLATFELP